MTEEFDAIIIGAGEAGTQVESMVVPTGKKVALIYQDPYGGTCLNVGCIPSKFMIHRARIAHQVRTAARYHVSASAPTVDLAAIVKEKDERLKKEREGMLEDANKQKNLTLIKGQARFTGDHQITVQGRILHADKIFLATGQRPVVPHIEGLDRVQYYTNENVMNLTELPSHLVILGGGYIGCELGQCYRRYGSEVTIVQSNAHLVPNEEPEISKVIAQAFSDEGLNLLLGYKASRIEPTEQGIRLTVQNKAGDERTVAGSHLFVAIGRQSNGDTLDLQVAGIETDDKGNIKVNDYLETNISGIYAIGDANGQQPFTPACLEEGKVAYTNAFG
ncbi:MAG: dihydrolipoamide dehydrogenase, partial [Candidatus Chloroheliales bacterium]